MLNSNLPNGLTYQTRFYPYLYLWTNLPINRFSLVTALELYSMFFLFCRFGSAMVSIQFDKTCGVINGNFLITCTQLRRVRRSTFQRVRISYRRTVVQFRPVGYRVRQIRFDGIIRLSDKVTPLGLQIKKTLNNREIIVEIVFESSVNVRILRNVKYVISFASVYIC